MRATTETQTQRHGRHYAANAEIAPSETRKSVNRRYAAARNSRRAFKIVTAACVVTLAAAVFAIPVSTTFTSGVETRTEENVNAPETFGSNNEAAFEDMNANEIVTDTDAATVPAAEMAAAKKTPVKTTAKATAKTTAKASTTSKVGAASTATVKKTASATSKTAAKMTSSAASKTTKASAQSKSAESTGTGSTSSKTTSVSNETTSKASTTTSKASTTTSKASTTTSKTTVTATTSKTQQSSKATSTATSKTNTYVYDEDDYVAPKTSTSYGSGSPLISISNVDYSYSPKHISLSAYDRDIIERLVYGEVGETSYLNCCIVAQAIRDAMNIENTSSVDDIIYSYGYYGSLNFTPNSDTKNAVSFIFDQDGMALQHRVICFYIGTSAWHETQNFLYESPEGIRFFDLIY